MWQRDPLGGTCVVTVAAKGEDEDPQESVKVPVQHTVVVEETSSLKSSLVAMARATMSREGRQSRISLGISRRADSSPFLVLPPTSARAMIMCGSTKLLLLKFTGGTREWQRWAR